MSLNILNELNWKKEFPYKPIVKVLYLYEEDSMCVKFDVKEKDPKAAHCKNGESICEDSCVELFVKQENIDFYFNFEFNNLGFCNAFKRKSRDEEVTPFTLEMYNQISVETKPIVLEKDNLYSWSLIINIPYSLLELVKRPDFLYGNIYKCGDKTQIPHYLSLFPIGTLRPDFHRAEYFKKLL